jgi:excisionase family DNA binding protein
MSEPLLNVADVALRLNVKTSWVYAKVEAGELPHLKLGHYVRFEAAAIETYLAKLRQGAA